MSAFLTASLVLALLVSSFSISAGQEIITAKPGGNVTLPCRAAENKDVLAVEWNRTDLESDHYVLLYKDSQFDPGHQSPFFKDRVSLLDVKNRDVSLVLKKVTTDDTGTYECRVFEKGNNRRKRFAVKSSSTVDLNVKPGNNIGLIVGLSVFAVAVVVGGVAAVLYKRSRYSSPRSKRPPPAAADAEETLTGPDE